MQRYCPAINDAVSKYYAAFPALKKGQQSPLQYYLPPPSWCRKVVQDSNKVNMQNDLSSSKDWNVKKKFSFSKERRNSYHGQRKYNKKRCHSYSRSFESNEDLPEWVTHEGVWDMETQDPVREFIRAIALDEGYGTCENTVTDEVKDITRVSVQPEVNMVPDCDDLDFASEWIVTEDEINSHIKTPIEEELYAKFEAKFDRSLEALWSKDQANTPDDEYQDLPIDFQDLLSSPSDRQFCDPSTEKSRFISLTESVRSNDALDADFAVRDNVESPNGSVDTLHDRFKPLKLEDDARSARLRSPTDIVVEPFSLYNYEDVYDAVPSVANVMRSLTALNHSKTHSSFTEVLPRRRLDRETTRDEIALSARDRDSIASRRSERDREDLLTSSRTHFRPIRSDVGDATASVVRYADGATFDIRGDLDPVEFDRSESGFIYLRSETRAGRYLEYRAARSIDYGRLNLTAAQREANAELDDRGEFRLKFPVRQLEKGVQTDRESVATSSWSPCDRCARLVGAKKMRQTGLDAIWSVDESCGACSAAGRGEAGGGGGGGGGGASAATLADEELARDWEELLSELSAAHAHYAAEAGDVGVGGVGVVGGGEVETIATHGRQTADRKRRHSAALRCGRAGRGQCSLPHAPFLHCCASDRPLTR